VIGVGFLKGNTDAIHASCANILLYNVLRRVGPMIGSRDRIGRLLAV